MKTNFEKISIETIDKNVNIKINDNIEIPQTLYKYYVLSHFAVESLENSTVHFGHSYRMNDLMDGNFLLWDFDGFLDTYMHEMQLPMQQKENYRHYLLNEISKDFLQYIGYFCLCETHKNDLLWTHYTNEKGYCIEFDTQLLLNSFKAHQSYFFPINYGELKRIDFEKHIIKTQTNGKRISVDANIPLFYTLANKEGFWNYEKEWRLIIRDKNFSPVSRPENIISAEKSKKEKEDLKSRNLQVSRESINKIILSTLFFNNERFDHFETINNEVVQLTFLEDKFKKDLIKFLTILREEFGDKIFQVNKYLKEGMVIRDITYKVEILEITEKHVQIRKMPYPNVY
ncbi:DUF2971 domain-containing protein [Chryseobacterium sp. JK1]|uniref:DUF2971 domain-containing protein n=1 Tax=Chryseobacterium sp. JK1 TaxID=874294 RepID=UPI003D69D146